MAKATEGAAPAKAPAAKPKAVKAAAPKAPEVKAAAEAKPKSNLMVVDAQGLVLGRASTYIAKALLSNLEAQVVVINAEKAVITGSPKGIEAKYHHRRVRGKERRGPFYPTRPEKLFKRAVRGMLPWKQDRGRKAYRRLKCYNGVPKQFAGVKAERPAHATSVRTAKYTTLEQVAQMIGTWRPVE